MEKLQTEVKIGKFKSPLHLTGFFGEKMGSRSLVEHSTDEATIDGKFISGLGYENHKFKLTICDENTLDFEVVEGNDLSDQTKQNLLDLIFEKSVSQNAKKQFFLDGLPFKSVEDPKLNLILTFQKNRLANFFTILEHPHDLDESQVERIDSLLSSLFGEEGFEPEVEEHLVEVPVETVGEITQETTVDTLVLDSFAQMKKEKIEELTRQLEKKKEDLIKSNTELDFFKHRSDSIIEEIAQIENRLDNLKPNQDLNGYSFFLSEKTNHKNILDEQVLEVIKNRVSTIDGINTDVFMKIFQCGEFHIHLGEKVGDETIEVDYEKLPSPITEILNKNGIFLCEKYFVLVSDIAWSELVNKLVKLGFEHDGNFVIEKNENVSSGI